MTPATADALAYSRENRISVEDAAAIAGRSPKQFYKDLQRSVPVGVWGRIGRSIYCDKARLIEWLSQGGQAANHAA